MPSMWPWATSLVRDSFSKWDFEMTIDMILMRNLLPFSGLTDMSTNNDLVLSEVVHKAFVEVNEEGTEAAAATAGLMMLRCAMPTERFYADHPFLFFIRHNSSLSFLFSGRCCSPEWGQTLRIVVNGLCRGFLLVLKRYKSYIKRVIRKENLTLNSCQHSSATLLCAFFTICLLHCLCFALIFRTGLTSFIYLVSVS